MLFTDTDSLCYEIETKDACVDFWEDRGTFGNSDYSKHSP